MVAYVRRKGVWTKTKDIRYKSADFNWANSVKRVYHKQGGVWTYVHNNEIPPINNVQLNLEVNAGQTKNARGDVTNQWRFFQVRTRLSELSDNPDLQSILVLVSANGFPTSPFSQGYYDEPSVTYPEEPWSVFGFLDYDSSTDKLKNFWPGASQSAGTVMPGGKTFYVTAFARSIRGHYGSAVTRQITLPNNFGDDDRRFFEARFTPIDWATRHYAPVGTESPWSKTTLDTGIGYNNGQSETFFFYGGQILQALGTVSAPSINTMQIYLQRSAANIGPAGAADVRLAVHNFGVVDDDVSDLIKTTDDATMYLGSLLKGEGKWFTVPHDTAAILQDSPYRGVSLHIDAAFASTPLNAQIRLEKPEFAPRQGELSITWTEA